MKRSQKQILLYKKLNLLTHTHTHYYTNLNIAQIHSHTHTERRYYQT